MRIGSAHAKERAEDRQALEGLLEKFIEQVNIPFDNSTENNQLSVLELPKGDK